MCGAKHVKQASKQARNDVSMSEHRIRVEWRVVCCFSVSLAHSAKLD